MKLIIILTVFIFMSNEVSSFTESERHEFSLECLTENGLDISFMEKLEKGLPIDKKTCFFACVYKKMGILKDNGSYNYDDILNSPLVSESDKKGIQADSDNAVKSCTAKVGNDHCEVAFCYFKIYGF